jgi:hypothetical protein
MLASQVNAVLSSNATGTGLTHDIVARTGRDEPCALERGQLPLTQLGFDMSRAVVLQHGDDHREVGVPRPRDHTERHERAVLGAADHDLTQA